MSINRLFFLIGLCAVYCFESTTCYRILGVFEFAGRSHHILASSLMKGLAEAGHDVTIISPFEEKDVPKNGSYRNVVLTGFIEDFNNMIAGMNLFDMDQNPINGLFMQYMFLPITEKVFNHPNVQALLKSGQKFDAVIMEQFFNDATSIFAHLFDANLILFSSTGPTPSINRIAGNPYPLSYIPDVIMDFPPNMSFFQRVLNTLSYSLTALVEHAFIFPRYDKVIKKYFPDAPDFVDLYHNASIMLLNSHESLSQPVPLVPNLIEISGFHIKPPKKLPKDLQEFLDEAKDGVVYFSLGSNLKSKDLPADKRDIFLTALSKLKQKVLWKWEDDVLPGQPPNVKLGRWFPQQDILAHPNVKVFITHGGMLSTTEAVYHGVPLLAIPVYGDQHKNSKAAEVNGYGLILPYHDADFTEERLSYLLNQLLYNPQYRDNVQQRSRVFHDRPLKPMENAVYWVEYAIRHRGAPHLRVAGTHLPWYKYFLVDVISFIAGVTIATLALVYLGVKRLLCHRKSATRTQKVKQN